MKHSKISITVLTMAIFGNSVNCFAVSQRRQTLRPKHVTGQLITPNIVIPTETPTESVTPETPSDNNNSGNDNTGNNNTDNSVTDSSTDTDDKEKKERIKTIKAKYRKHLNDAQLNCIGISDRLQFIKNLSTGTIVVSGVGALTAGGALMTEIIDDKNDSDKFNHDKAYMAETGLLIGSAATSAGGVVTSAIAISNADSLISKIKDCKNDISNIKLTMTEMVEEDVDKSDDTFLEINDVISKCDGLDSKSMDNIKAIKNLLIGSTFTSGVGTLGSVAAAVTNAKYHEENDKGDDKDAKKAKKLSIASKATTAVVAAAQTATLGLSIAQTVKLDKDKDTADNCEEVLMKY